MLFPIILSIFNFMLVEATSRTKIVSCSIFAERHTGGRAVFIDSVPDFLSISYKTSNSVIIKYEASYETEVVVNWKEECYLLEIRKSIGIINLISYYGGQEVEKRDFYCNHEFRVSFNKTEDTSIDFREGGTIVFLAFLTEPVADESISVRFADYYGMDTEMRCGVILTRFKRLENTKLKFTQTGDQVSVSLVNSDGVRRFLYGAKKILVLKLIFGPNLLNLLSSKDPLLGFI